MFCLLDIFQKTPQDLHPTGNCHNGRQRAQKLTEAVDDAIQTLSSAETSDDSDKPIDGVVWDISRPSTVACLRH
jgi:hypothetical protein